MISDAIELLDRQYRLLASMEGNEDFLGQLYAFLEVIEHEPRLHAAFEECIRGAQRAIEAVRAHDETCTQELVELRSRFTARWPPHDDSAMQKPGLDEGGHGQYLASLAHFDNVAKSPVNIFRSTVQNWTKDETRTKELGHILHNKLLSLVDPGPDAEDGHALMSEVVKIERRHHLAITRWRLALRAGGSVAVLRLAWFAELLGVSKRLSHMMPDGLRFVVEDVPGFVSPLIALINGQPRSDYDERAVPRHLDLLRQAARRGYEEMRAQLGTTRSHRAAVARFAARCEWYDAEELRLLAEAHPHGVEDVLTQRLARYLFDLGFNPLTAPLAGGLRPDLLDPTVKWTFYVEAKQYADRGGITRATKDAVIQIRDSVGRLRGTPYEVHEAFLVIFRVAGPRCALPSEVRPEGFSLIPILVDIAAPSESGSRNREQPVDVPADWLLPDREPGTDEAVRG